MCLWGINRLESSWSLLSKVDASDQHGRSLRALSWNAMGDMLAVASFDATVSLWKEVPVDQREEGDGSSLECVALVTGHENEVKSAVFSPSGELLATCSRDKSVWLYSMESLECECVAVLQSHTQDVKMVRWHPTQDVLFSCSYDDTIKVWGPDEDDWACKETLTGHASTVWAMSFDSVGARFVSCSEDCSLRIWAPEGDTATKKPKTKLSYAVHVSPLFRGMGALPEATLTPPADAACAWHCIQVISDVHPRAVYSVDWLKLSEKPRTQSAIATACGDNHIRIFECIAEVWVCVADVAGHDGDVNAVAWSPRSGEVGEVLLASAGDDAKLLLWRYAG